MNRLISCVVCFVMICLSWSISGQDIYIGEPTLKNNYLQQIPVGKIGGHFYALCLSPKQTTFIKYDSKLNQQSTFAVSSLEGKDIELLKAYVHDDFLYLLKWERGAINKFSVDVFDEEFEPKGNQVLAEVDAMAKNISFYLDPISNKVVFYHAHSDKLFLYNANINSFDKLKVSVPAKSYEVTDVLFTQDKLYVVSNTLVKAFQNKDSIQVLELDLTTQRTVMSTLSSGDNFDYVKFAHHPVSGNLIGGYFNEGRGELTFNEITYSEGELSSRQILISDADLNKSSFVESASIITKSIVPRSDGGYLVQGELFSTEQRIMRTSPFDGGGLNAVSTLENYEDLLVLNVNSTGEVDKFQLFPKSQQVIDTQKDIASVFTMKTPTGVYALYNDLYSLGSAVFNAKLTNTGSYKIQSLQMSRGEYIDVNHGIQVSNNEVLFPILGEQKKILLFSF